MSTANVIRKRRFGVSLTVTTMFLAVTVSACAALNDALEKAKSSMSAPAGSGSGAPEAGGTGADPNSSGQTNSSTPAGNNPSGGNAPGGSGGDNPHCCVGGDASSQVYYDCKTADNAIKCMGNPMSLISCHQKCKAGDKDCPLKCIGQYGPSPDRGHCSRDPSRDAQCKK